MPPFSLSGTQGGSQVKPYGSKTVQNALHKTTAAYLLPGLSPPLSKHPRTPTGVNPNSPGGTAILKILIRVFIFPPGKIIPNYLQLYALL